MRAGRLTRRVQIEKKTTVRDAYGDETETWSLVTTRWAAVVPINGREFFDAEQVNSKVSVRIRLRYDSVTSAIKTSYRIVYGAVVFDIKSIINVDEANDELILMCSSVTHDG